MFAYRRTWRKQNLAGALAMKRRRRSRVLTCIKGERTWTLATERRRARDRIWSAVRKSTKVAISSPVLIQSEPDLRASGAGRADSPGQKARRLPCAESASCFGWVCLSPQNNTAANTVNIATTKRVTSKESVGMRLSPLIEESVPAGLDRVIDLNQTDCDLRGSSCFAAVFTLPPSPRRDPRRAGGPLPRR